MWVSYWNVTLPVGSLSKPRGRASKPLQERLPQAHLHPMEMQAHRLEWAQLPVPVRLPVPAWECFWQASSGS